MRSESAFLTFNGMRVNFTVVMPDDPNAECKRRILLLNAPLSVSENWRLLLPELLAQKCLIVLVDLPGYGASACGKGVPQDPVRRAGFVWGILDQIDRYYGGKPQMWHLMTHGSSALTALTMARQQPDAVVSTVLLSPIIQSPVPQMIKRVPGQFDKKFNEWYDTHLRTEEGMFDMLREWFGRPISGNIMELMCPPLRRRGMREMIYRLFHEGYSSDPGIFKGFTPCMVLWGQQDPLIRSAEADIIRSCLCNAELHTLHTAGHFPQETHSRAVSDYLRGWLNYIDPI